MPQKVETPTNKTSFEQTYLAAERELAAGSVEQANTQPILQRVDITRYRSGREPDATASSREAAGLHNNDEQFHVAQAGQVLHIVPFALP